MRPPIRRASTPDVPPGYRGTMANLDVVLITKADCHLCSDARAAVDRVTAALGIDWTEQSVDDDAALRERFAEEIPVVLVNGVQRDFWRIDEARLARTLRRALDQRS
ncbi:MAG: glutaredoxin family protein [Arthrobacter sp.]|nr:glutaredoxin family protein [Arthrobacter sp.]